MQRTGYTFDGYDKTIPTTIPAENVVITAKWEANTDTKYRVQYYLQNAENDGYTLYKTESLTGTTDTTAKAEIKKFEHFTYSPSSTDSGNIAPDGSTVLKVYYNRDRYTVTFEANGGTLRSGYITQSVKYGDSAVAPTFVKTGYSFDGWDKEIPTVMSAENITITAQWKINQYSITVVYGNGRENEVITQDYNSAVNFVLPTDLQRDAYTFNGYNNIIPTVMPAYNMTIYAQWLAIFNTSYGTITGLTAHGATFSEITIPSEIDNVSITGIGDSAFYGYSSLISVKLPDGITTIENKAFYNCSSLTKIVIPNSVTSIGSYVFYNCCNLTSLTIGDGVTSIGNSSFKLCTALYEIKYNATSCSDFRDNSCIFYDAGTSGLGVKVTIGKNVKRIPAHLFNAWGGAGFPKIIQIEFEENSICEHIGPCAFYNGSFLTTITLPDSITSIGGNAFRACSSLASVHYTGTIDQWVQISFGDYYSNPIYYTNNLYINNKLVTEAKITTATKINGYSFYDYGGLTSVIIGDSVTSIEWYAFKGCYSLKKVYYVGTPEEWTRLNINSNNTYLKNATRYYYIENEDNVPTDGGNYWHYDENGNAVEW